MKKTTLLVVIFLLLGMNIAFALPSCWDFTKHGSFESWKWNATPDIGFTLKQSVPRNWDLQLMQDLKTKAITGIEFRNGYEMRVKFGKKLSRASLKKLRLRINVDGQFVVQKKIEGYKSEKFKDDDLKKLVSAFRRGNTATIKLLSDENTYRDKWDFSLSGFSAALKKAEKTQSQLDRSISCDMFKTDKSGY